jgi:3-phosphoshikimate 1-carboxyvinyltransferase
MEWTGIAVVRIKARKEIDRLAISHFNLLPPGRIVPAMPLPAVIEIVPLEKLVEAEISVPGSKSITNRALILSALAEGETVLRGALWSEDTQVMVECLQELGYLVNVTPDPVEACNRTVTVYGRKGVVPRGGSSENPFDLFVGNAGTAARFLAAMVCLGEGVYRLHGAPRMHERPQAALFRALRELGYRIDAAPGEKLPALIHGAGPRSGRCQVSIAESSQFASALLLCAGTGGWRIEITGENVEESAYVALTRNQIATFLTSSGKFFVEPDASSASYVWGADAIQCAMFGRSNSIRPASAPVSGWQIDDRFKDFLPLDNPKLGGTISRATQLGDSIMTAIVLAPLAGKPIQFTDLGRLRVQECERVFALRTELTRCGAKVIETGDSLEVFPSTLHGAEIETYEDHRVAMCFAILGLKVPGIRIKNPSCVKKTFPNFFQKLAAPPPRGLGVTIFDTAVGRPLDASQLFAG